MLDLINGNGYDQADLMIISDYARKADETSKLCLSGYYKQKLGEFLNSADITINQTYRTCIIKNYVKGLGMGTYNQDKKVLEMCFETAALAPLSFYMDVLIDEINTIKPAVIICLGDFTLHILTGRSDINKFRGSVLPIAEDISMRLTYPMARNLKIVCSLHPNVVHTQEELQFLIRLDFKKAVEILFRPENHPVDHHEIYIARSSMDTLRFLERYPISKYPKMTYDIETHRGFITCAGISFDGNAGLSIPLIGNHIYDQTETARNLYLLSKELDSRELINQNIGYDKRVSQRFGLWLKNVVWDTMLAAHTIVPEFKKNLGFLTSIYTDMSYYKDEGHDFNPSKESFDVLYSYNAKDAISCYQIYLKQLEDLQGMGMLDFFNNFVMKLFDSYYDSDSIGMICNISRRDELNNKYQGLIDLKEMELFSITQPDKLNLNSPSQIGKWMENNNFPILRHRVKSGFMVPNTDVDSLKKMLIADPLEYRKCNIPYELAIRFLNLILLIRRIDKVLEYIGVGIHPWGRIHTSSRLSATTNGRTGGGKTPDQWPVWVRDKKDELKIKWIKLGQSFQTVTKHGFIIQNEEDEDGNEILEEGIEEGIIGKDLREMYEPDKDWLLVEVDGSQAEARVCDVLGEAWDSLAEYGKVDKHCKVASMIFSTVTHKGKRWTYDEIFYEAKKLKSDDGTFMRQIGKHSKHAKNNGMEPFLFAQKYLILPTFSESLKQATLVLRAIDKAYPNIEDIFHKQVEIALRAYREIMSPKIYGLPSGRLRRFYKKIDKHYLNVAYSYIPQTTISDHTKAAKLRINDRVDKLKAYVGIAENHDSLTSLVKRGYLREYCLIAKEEMERPIDFRPCTLSRDFQLVIPCEFSIGRSSWGKMKEIKKIKCPISSNPL